MVRKVVRSYLHPLIVYDLDYCGELAIVLTALDDHNSPNFDKLPSSWFDIDTRHLVSYWTFKFSGLISSLQVLRSYLQERVFLVRSWSCKRMCN